MTKEEKKEYDRKHYLKNREKKLEQSKRWYQENRERKLELGKLWYQENKDKFIDKRAEQHKHWYKENKDKVLEYISKYNKTPYGRAIYLVSNYRKKDKTYNRGECTLTPEWIVDNIFTKSCNYCDERDWTKLGCDRINNDLPHTPDNVVPCCKKCNDKRGTKGYEEFMLVIRKDV